MRDQLENGGGDQDAARAGWLGLGAVVAYGVLVVLFVRSELNDFNPPNRHPLWRPEPEMPHALELAAFVITALAAALVARSVWRALRLGGLSAFRGLRALGVLPIACVAGASVLAAGGAIGELEGWRAHVNYMEVVGERRVSGDWLEFDGERLYAWDGRSRSRVEDVSAALAGLAKELDGGEWLIVELDDVAASVAGTEVLLAALDTGVDRVLLLPDGAGGPMEEPVWITQTEDFEGYLMALTMDASGTPGAGVLHQSLDEKAQLAGTLVTEVWEPVNAKNSPEADVLRLRRRWQADGGEEPAQGRLAIGAGVPMSIWGGWLASLADGSEVLQVVLMRNGDS